MSEGQLYQDEVLNALVNPNWKNETIEFEKSKAYDEGFKKGLNAKDLAIRQFFLANIDKATKISEALFKKLEELHFSCKHMMLNPRDLKSFELLCIVDEKTYLSPNRKIIYEFIRALKKENNSNEFLIECLIMPENGEINMNLILSEGFTLRYEPKSR